MQSNHFHESNLISCKLTSWKMFNFVLIVSCMYLDFPVRNKKNEKQMRFSFFPLSFRFYSARCVLCAWMYDDVSALWNYDTEQATQTEMVKERTSESKTIQSSVLLFYCRCFILRIILFMKMLFAFWGPCLPHLKNIKCIIWIFMCIVFVQCTLEA